MAGGAGAGARDLSRPADAASRGRSSGRGPGTGVAAALDAEGGGVIVSASRQILYASPGDDFAEAARRAALGLRDEINRERDALLARR